MFEMKSEKKWKHQWICNERFKNLTPIPLLHKQQEPEFQMEQHKEELKNIHTLFRKEINMQHDFSEVYLDISADDYYKLYINGTYVTQGPANSYYYAYFYNHIDVTKYMKKGNNVFCVHVYYQGLINRNYNSGDYRQGMIGEIFVDGQLWLDDQWKYKEAEEYGKSRTIAYETQFDEIIDQSKKLVGWKEVNYLDQDWAIAPVKNMDDHQLILQQTKNLQMEQVIPKSIKKLSDGYLLDFGTELTGTFYINVVGEEKDEIVILFAEELENENQVRNNMRCNCFYEDKWILVEGKNELEQFEYKCFRYVQLRMKSSIDWKDCWVDYRHYPFDENFCSFHTKDPLLNQIWMICKNAVKNCAQEAFLDCPHREKGQYLGDLTITGHAHLCLTGDPSLFKKALRDFRNSTQICPGMMAVAPGSFMQEIADFSLMFPYQLQIYYEFTKDQEFLREMLPVAEGIRKYFAKFENKNFLLENVITKWNLVDWPENLRDNYDFDLSQPIVGNGCHNVINALYIGMEKCIEELKELLNIPYISTWKLKREEFIHAFYKEETGLFTDSFISEHSSLHANVYSIFYGLAPTGNNIVEFIRQKGLACGVYTSYFLLMGLGAIGEKELIYALLTNKTKHSWYNMLKEGATTAYEAWGKEQKWNTSLCHGWAAAPIPVLIKYFEDRNK